MSDLLGFLRYGLSWVKVLPTCTSPLGIMLLMWLVKDATCCTGLSASCSSHMLGFVLGEGSVQCSLPLPLFRLKFTGVRVQYWQVRHVKQA
jgi:hypothetical protein